MHTDSFPGLLMTLNGLVYMLYDYRLRSSRRSKPLWSTMALICDSAIEFPLFLTFHPTILTQSPAEPTLPCNKQLLFQVVVFFAVEIAFQNCVLSFISIDPETPRMSDKISVSPENTKRELSYEAENTVFDFLRPRGTLLLGIVILGASTTLTQHTGPPHPMAIVLWVGMGQVVDFRSYGRSFGISPPTEESQSSVGGSVKLMG